MTLSGCGEESEILLRGGFQIADREIAKTPQPLANLQASAQILIFRSGYKHSLDTPKSKFIIIFLLDESHALRLNLIHPIYEQHSTRLPVDDMTASC